MNINVGNISLSEVKVINAVTPPITGSVSFAADKGEISPGQVLAKDESGDAIPSALNTEEDMTGTVNGTNKVFTYDAQGSICPGSVAISHGEQDIEDDGCGNLVGDGSGTVNYKTGEVSATFDTAPANESDSPVIGYCEDPEFIALNDVDTASAGAAEDSGLVLVAGAVITSVVKVGSDDVPGYVKDRLRLKGIHFVQ